MGKRENEADAVRVGGQGSGGRRWLENGWCFRTRFCIFSSNISKLYNSPPHGMRGPHMGIAGGGHHFGGSGGIAVWADFQAPGAK